MKENENLEKQNATRARGIFFLLLILNINKQSDFIYSEYKKEMREDLFRHIKLYEAFFLFPFLHLPLCCTFVNKLN